MVKRRNSGEAAENWGFKTVALLRIRLVSNQHEAKERNSDWIISYFIGSVQVELAQPSLRILSFAKPLESSQPAAPR